jgi:DNA-binding IclR family transcriptional regulator
MTVASAELARTESSTDGTSIPEEIDTAQAKLVYLALVETNARTTEELVDLLELSKLTLFDVLSTLSERGLVERDGQRCYPVALER